MSAKRISSLGVAGLCLLAWVLWLGLPHGRGAGHAAAPPAMPPKLAVPVVAVLQSTVPVYLEYVGTTDAIRSVTLEAEVTGYLQRYAVADGSDVRRKQLLYQIDPRAYQAALDQARAQAQRDAAVHEYAVANRRRDVTLSKTGDVSIDTAQLATSTEHQDAASQAADRAAIEAAQLNLSYTSIRAPFAGRLSDTQVYEGALITVAGTQLNTLVQLDPIYVTFTPPDSDLPQIEQAQARAPISAEVIVGSATTPSYGGHLSFLNNTVDRGTGTIMARATIANPAHTLLPGQFVRVRLRVGEQAHALLVPQIAVESSQLGQYVYVIDAQDRAEQRFVTLGADYGPWVVVSHGVSVGERVAIGNLLRLNPDEAVSPMRPTGPPLAPPVAPPASAPQRTDAP